MKKDLGDAPLPHGGWLIFIGIRLVGGLVMNGGSVTNTVVLDLNVTGQIIRILAFLIIIYVFVVHLCFSKSIKRFRLLTSHWKQSQ